MKEDVIEIESVQLVFWFEFSDMPPRSQRQQQQSSARNDDTCQAVIYTLPRQRSPYYENYCCRQSMCCGTTLLITGLLSVVLQSVSIAAGLIYSTVCHGIWCGVMVSHASNHVVILSVLYVEVGWQHVDKQQKLCVSTNLGTATPV